MTVKVKRNQFANGYMQCSGFDTYKVQHADKDCVIYSRTSEQKYGNAAKSTT